MVVTHGALQRSAGRCALTIGNFDGVHRGHRALIERMTAKARELSLTSCILTFEPHPREFFAPQAAPARLTRLRDKLALDCMTVNGKTIGENCRGAVEPMIEGEAFHRE